MVFELKMRGRIVDYESDEVGAQAATARDQLVLRRVCPAGDKKKRIERAVRKIS